jgi:hypothetical protein
MAAYDMGPVNPFKPRRYLTPPNHDSIGVALSLSHPQSVGRRFAAQTLALAPITLGETA